MRERLLIVNADDFNTDPERNRGILEAAAKGILTSTTVLANLPLAGATAAALREGFGPGVGIHLNLTQGFPLTAGARTLAGADGRFHGKHAAWRRALRRGYDPEEVEREFAAQIRRLLDCGIVPSHLDGNNHLHVFPGIAPVVARLAGRFGIRHLRLPLERGWGKRRLGSIKRRFIGLLACRAAAHFRAAGLVFPEHFAGIDFPRPGRREDLETLLRSLPGGVTELMCHPGYQADGGKGFSSRAREEELAALTCPAVLDVVRGGDIRLISFADWRMGRR